MGKTHLTKKVTEFMFNDERALVRIRVFGDVLLVLCAVGRWAGS